MRILRQIFLVGIGIFILIPVSWFLIYWTQRALGYFPGGHFPTIAKKAAAEHNVELCRRIVGLPWPTIGGPSTMDARISCIHEYAALAQDPTACELLLPSEYGLSCIGESMSRIYIDNPDVEHVKFADCAQVKGESLTQDRCGYLKAHYSRSTKDCEPIQNDVIRKACFMKFEAWEKYPELRKSSYFGVAAEQ